MSGFGNDPLGKDSFGHAAWSRNVLFDLLPSIYRQLDGENGGYLEKWTEGLRPPFDTLLARIDSWSDLRDALRVRTKYNETIELRLGRVREPESRIEQRGVDGSISVARVFSSPSARFSGSDAGKTLVLAGSGVPINNRSFKIAKVVSIASILCDPPLVVDPGPIRWEVKGFPDLPSGEMEIEVRGGDVGPIGVGWILSDGASEFEIIDRQRFFPVEGESRALTTREGRRAQALTDGRLRLEVALLQQDVGKPITVSGSQFETNNSKFQIHAVDPSSPDTLSLTAPVTIVGVNPNGNVTYALQPGHSGIQVRHAVEGLLTPLSVAVADSRITINLATNGAGVATSTANQVAAAIVASADASDRVAATAGGNGNSPAGPSDFVLIPGAALAEDSGPLVWALLPFPKLTVLASAPPKGIIGQEGVDLLVSGAPTNDVTAQTAGFIASDVGKLLVIRGSSLGSDGVYAVAAVTSATSLRLTAPMTLPAESNLTWELRTPSTRIDTTTVLTRAPSLIDFLAADYALTLDQEDTEARQRGWVANSFQWMDLKATRRGYEVIGALSGYVATPLALYRLALPVSADMLPAHLFVIGETEAGRSGTDGKITAAGPSYFFTAASAAFRSSDVGVSLRFADCSNPTNNRIFEIVGFVSPTVVEIVGTLTAPDYGLTGTPIAPATTWNLVRLYTDEPPDRIRFDEVNIDLMQEIVGPTHFQVDRYCWDPIVTESFTIDITNVTPPVSTGVQTLYTVEVTGILQGTGFFSTARVIGLPEAWKITDSGGTTFFIDSMPVMTAAGPPEVHTFTVQAAAPPALGAASMTYICDTIVSCDYCKSSVVAVLLSPI